MNDATACVCVQCVLSHAGLRGAIAYALSLNFPVELDQNGRSVTNLIVNSTTFTILVSVFLLGPTTPPLLKCLRITMGKTYVSGSSTADLRPWQKKVQNMNQNRLLTWLTKNPTSHSYKDVEIQSACVRACVVVRVVFRRSVGRSVGWPVARCL